MVPDTSLQYKVCIKGKMEQSRKGVAPSLHLGVVAIEKGAFWSLSTTVANLQMFSSISIKHEYFGSVKVTM